MNEMLFKNEFVRDESCAKALYRYWYFKRPMLVAFYCYGALCTIGSIFATVSGLCDIELTVALLLVVLFSVILFVASYFANVRMMVKRDREISDNGNLYSTVMVDEEKITHTTSSGSISVKLDQVKSVARNNGYIFIMTKASLAYAMKEDSFTIGDSESLFEFLKSKGIKVKK